MSTSASPHARARTAIAGIRDGAALIRQARRARQSMGRPTTPLVAALADAFGTSPHAPSPSLPVSAAGPSAWSSRASRRRRSPRDSPRCSPNSSIITPRLTGRPCGQHWIRPGIHDSSTAMLADCIVTNALEVITCAGPAPRRGVDQANARSVANAAVALTGGCASCSPGRRTSCAREVEPAASCTRRGRAPVARSCPASSTRTPTWSTPATAGASCASGLPAPPTPSIAAEGGGILQTVRRHPGLQRGAARR